MLAKIREYASAGLAVRGKSAGVGLGVSTGYSYLNNYSLTSFLPGARSDDAQQAGRLWLNGVVLTCLKWQCRTFHEAPLMVFRGDPAKPEPVPGHALLALLKKPNPWQTVYQVWAGTLLSWGVDGNGYWYKLRNGAGRLVGYQYLPHFRVKPQRERGSVGISFYQVSAEQSLRVLPADMLHFRNGYDPDNDLCGLSDLAAELRSIVGDNGLATFHKSLLKNMGVPGVALSPKGDAVLNGPAGPANPIWAETFKKLWKEKFTGENVGEPFINAFPLEIAQLGLSPKDLEASVFAKLYIPRICAAIGLDPMAVNLPSESKTYANYTEAREAAYEGNIIPLHRALDDAITDDARDEGLLRPDEYLSRDYSKVRILQPDRDKVFARVTAAVGNKPWMTVDEGRAEAGLPPLTEAQRAEMTPPAPEPPTPEHQDTPLPEDTNP